MKKREQLELALKNDQETAFTRYPQKSSDRKVTAFYSEIDRSLFPYCDCCHNRHKTIFHVVCIFYFEILLERIQYITTETSASSGIERKWDAIVSLSSFRESTLGRWK